MPGNKAYAPEQVGNVRHIEIADPGTGVQWSFTAPATPDAGTMFKIESISYRFFAGAVIQVPGVELVTATPRVVLDAYLPTGTTQAAGTTFDYRYNPNLPVQHFVQTNTTINIHNISMPIGWILPGETLQSNVISFNATSVFTLIVLAVREWRVAVDL